MRKCVAVAVLVAGCGGGTQHVVDAGPDGDATNPAITCDPTDDWDALEAASAGNPGLADLGDAVAVTPEEVGDGRYHLFVGVYHPEIISNGHGVAVIHEAVSTDPHQPFTLSPTPIVSTFDSYDANGIETPTYVRADAHTEYIYYCALYDRLTSGTSVMEKGEIAGLVRVDGGAWTKLGPIAPFAAGSSTQCEGEVVFDPATNLYVLYYVADTAPGGVFVRTSADPASYPASSETFVTQAWSRMGVSYDPVASTWRFALDEGGYPSPLHLAQSWAPSSVPGAETLAANAAPLHEPLDNLHAAFHLDAAGSVLQNSRAIYAGADEVIFFYTGIGTSGHLHVIGQRRRRQ